MNLFLKFAFFGVGLTAVLAAFTIWVQIYTDIELVNRHDYETKTMIDLKQLSDSLYKIILVLIAELEPAYRFSRADYDIYFEEAKESIRNTDTQLLYIDRWPTDFRILSDEERINVTSLATLRSAIRAQRERRRLAINGTSPEETMESYSKIIDNLGKLVRGKAWLDTARFEGWRVYLSSYYAFQAILDFQRFTIMGHRFAGHNDTFDTRDEEFRELLIYSWRYHRFLEIFAMTSNVGQEVASNFTVQEAAKELESKVSLMERFNIHEIILDDWDRIGQQNLANLYFAYNQMVDIYNDGLRHAISHWNDFELVSFSLFAVAASISLVLIGVHAFACKRIHGSIKSSEKVLNEFRHLARILNDYTPAQEVSNFTDYMLSQGKCHIAYKNICLCLASIFQIDRLIGDLDQERFVEIIDAFNLTIENTFQRYKSCTKINIFSGELAVASGLSDQSQIKDHVILMVLFALDLLETFQEAMEQLDQNVSLVLGIDSGAATVSIVQLKVPKTLILGRITRRAAIMQSFSLPRKIHVSDAVYYHAIAAQGIGELEFVERKFSESDRILISELPLSDRPITTYWAQWSDDHTNMPDVDGKSIVSISTLIK